MRLALGFAVAALLALGPAASAQGPVATAVLAPGEMLLEIDADGRATVRADQVVLGVSLNVTGGEEADVRRALATVAERLAAAARAAGAELQMGPLNVIGAEMFGNMMMNSVDVNAAESMMAGSYGDASARVTLTDLSRLASLRQSIEAAGAGVSTTDYRVADEGPGRRQARQNALAAARAEADAYAATLNMRVVRMVRITERTSVDWFALMSGAAAERTLMETMARTRAEGEIEMVARLGVDFVLAPASGRRP